MIYKPDIKCICWEVKDFDGNIAWSLRKLEFIWMCTACTEELFVCRGWDTHLYSCAVQVLRSNLKTGSEQMLGWYSDFFFRGILFF